jgi:hypothetical protein
MPRSTKPFGALIHPFTMLQRLAAANLDYLCSILFTSMTSVFPSPRSLDAVQGSDAISKPLPLLLPQLLSKALRN